MGLEVVLNQIVAAGEAEERGLVEQAQFERDRVLSEAKVKAGDILAKGRAHADGRLEALRRELLSAAEFEARRRQLVATRELADDFRHRVLQALSTLPAKKNETILTKLVAQAKAEIPAGTVHARKADLPLLTKGGYKSGRELANAGGFQVESADGTILLDYRYETLLENAWKEILAENQNLFEP